MRVERVLVLVAHFPPAFLGGGPIRTLDAFVRAAPGDVSVDVLTSDRDLHQSVQLRVASDQWIESEHGRIKYASVGSLSGFLRTLLGTSRPRPDVVYVNSFFHPLFSILPWLLLRLGCWRGATFLLAPRGEFGHEALAIKTTKKMAVIRLFKLLRLPRRVVWHASTEAEAVSIRRVMGEDARIVVRRDDTDLPDTARAVVAREPGPFRLVHLGRLVPIKGLDVLLVALREVNSPVVLDVYGPFEDPGHVDLCRSLATRLPPHVRVNVAGPVRPEEVEGVLAAADLMAMPTRQESFGHVIAEALSASCPVMIPDTTPWTDVLRAGGGVVVEDREPTTWTRALDDYLAAGPDAWTERRQLAGAAYDKWVVESADAHVVEKLRALTR
ncbi:glycosyltransferase family 4 protein [Nocardioides jishulii]|uniref:Glycosyltransferase family 4 protein n=1 Tax=Nocardioides jishulii TaxID=2575440 RepID=A0A4V5TKH9_9ACTN|nr:glycosyltransferase family 4 protein [Nocardioides jishulii]QCX26491.1 glycosyltransferase family 4 protein [Nocardioides jishulii]TKI63703.1 glycosyltransferase family 4 protein [Nocardioides jishulii]